MRKIPAALAATVLLALTACGQSPAATAPAAATSPATSASPAATPTPQASPMTAAGAEAAASTYFDFYAAGQYAISYPLLAPSARKAVSEHEWVAVHDACPSKSGLAYKVSRPQVVGTTAVVNVSLAGTASALASAEESFTYTSGRWWFVPSDLSTYRGHTVAQAVATLKGQESCAS